ncbi:MAG TPA: hypothetical protein VFX98_13995 [Longimicrobiaceae bacterium]|nr:hypothetical protein [Longimicrobiaceae bacterium]
MPGAYVPRGPTGDSPHEPATRPWELELLISGAVVFSLLQLPGVVDRGYDRLEPHLAASARMAAFMLYYCLKLVLYTLIATFLLHLVTRAYWVGLIGLESVYPHGIRWDQTTYGPVMSEVYRERMKGLQPQIDRADRIGSVLFSYAFSIVLLLLVSIPIGALYAGVGFGLSQLFFEGRHMGRIVWLLFGVTMLLPLLVWGADRAFGARLEPGSGGRRLLRALSLVTYYVQAVPVYGSTMSVLFSNVSKKKIYPLFYAFFFGLIAFFIVKDLLVRRDVLAMDSYRYLPDDGGGWEVGYRFYESQRPPREMFPNTPSIQSDLIRDPYVRLFVPYSPRRHNDAIARACPELRPLQRGGLRLEGIAGPADSAAAGAVLACWKRVQPVELNGRPVEVDFRFYTHPRSGLRGMVGYLPVAGLPRGANLLTVGQAPRADDTPRRAAERKRNPYVIRFWL